MSTVPSTSETTSHSNFASVFNSALESYKRKTKKDLVNIFLVDNSFSNTYFQAFPPAHKLFAGIRELLLVGFSLCLPFTTHFDPFRWLRMPALLAKTSSATYLTASNASFAGLKFTLASHQLPL